MKKILFTLLLLLLVPCWPMSAAWALPSLVDEGLSNTPNVSTAVSCAVGDLMLVGTQGSAGGTPTVTGTVQGAYTFIKTVPGASFDFVNEFYKVCTTTGTETIAATGISVSRIVFAHIGTFSGAATVITADSNQASAAGTALNSGSVSTSVANEYFYGLTDQTGISVTGPSFQFITGNQNLGIWLGDPGSTGSLSPYPAMSTSVSLTATMASSNQWIAGIVGFYDAASAGTCTHKFWDNTANWSTPNGSTGSYWNLATANWSTPNCSTGTFYRQDGASAAN